MGVCSFVSFIITLSIILTNVFDGIDAKYGKRPLPPAVDWRRSELVFKNIERLQSLFNKQALPSLF